MTLTTRIGILSALAVVLGAVSMMNAAPALASTECQYAAHRGNHEQPGRTENGMPAVRAASQRFEVDVRTDASGALVIMHDATVGRTTNGTGRVARKTSAQIRVLLLDDGSRVPFAWRVLRHLQNNPGKSAVLHIKTVTGSKLIDLVRSYGVTSQVTFMSQRRADLDVAARYTHTAFLSNSAVDPAGYTAYDAIAVAIAAVTAQDVSLAHTSGLEYWTFTPNDESQWSAAAASGVDLVFTDLPSAFSGWCVTV